MKRKGQLKLYIIEYYRTALKSILNEKDVDEKNLQISQFFKRVSEEAHLVTPNQTVSGVVERVLSHVVCWKPLSRLLSGFATGGDWSCICTDRFAHRVLQSTINRCQEILELEENLTKNEADKEKVIKKCISLEEEDGVKKKKRKKDVDENACNIQSLDKNVKWRDRTLALLRTVCNHIQLHYPEFLEDPYGSHIIRSYLQLISGVRLPRTPFSGSHDVVNAREAVLVPPLIASEEDRRVILIDYANRFLLIKHLRSFVDSALMNPMLQVLLVVLSLRLPTEFRAICRHLLRQSTLFHKIDSAAAATTELAPDVFCQPLGSFFCEQLVALLPKKHFLEFVKNHVAGREALLAKTPHASFVLRAVLLRAEERTLDRLRYYVACLVPSLNDMLSSGQHVIVQVLVEAVAECSCVSSQSRLDSAAVDELSLTLCRALVAVLRRSTPATEAGDEDDVNEKEYVKSAERIEAAPRLLALNCGTTSQQQINTEAKLQDITVPGSLLLQAILRTKHGAHIFGRRSLARLSSTQLMCIAQHPAGSRALQVYLTGCGGFETEEKRISLLRTLAEKTSFDDKKDEHVPALVRLACDRIGSRLLEAVWDCLSTDQSRILLRDWLGPYKERLRSHQFGRHCFSKFGLFRWQVASR